MFGNYGNMMNWNGFGGYGFWLMPVMLWSLFWKALALWKSAKEDSKYWFAALLVINTMGLLELSYLFIFAKTKLTLTSSTPTSAKPIKSKK
jgi:methionyl-tRNA synthetase